MASKSNLAKLICRHVCAADVLQMCCNFAANCGHTYFCIIPSYSVSSVLPPCEISYFQSKKSRYSRFYRVLPEKRLIFQKIRYLTYFLVVSLIGHHVHECFRFFFTDLKKILDVYKFRGYIDVRVQLDEKE